MNKKEFSALAELGTLNALPDYQQDRHRRGALWHATAAAMPVSELLEPAVHDSEPSPLERRYPERSEKLRTAVHVILRDDLPGSWLRSVEDRFKSP